MVKPTTHALAQDRTSTLVAVVPLGALIPGFGTALDSAMSFLSTPSLPTVEPGGESPADPLKAISYDAKSPPPGIFDLMSEAYDGAAATFDAHAVARSIAAMMNMQAVPRLSSIILADDAGNLCTAITDTDAILDASTELTPVLSPRKFRQSDIQAVLNAALMYQKVYARYTKEHKSILAKGKEFKSYFGLNSILEGGFNWPHKLHEMNVGLMNAENALEYYDAVQWFAKKINTMLDAWHVMITRPTDRSQVPHVHTQRKVPQTQTDSKIVDVGGVTFGTTNLPEGVENAKQLTDTFNSDETLHRWYKNETAGIACTKWSDVEPAFQRVVDSVLDRDDSTPFESISVAENTRTMQEMHDDNNGRKQLVQVFTIVAQPVVGSSGETTYVADVSSYRKEEGNDESLLGDGKSKGLGQRDKMDSGLFARLLMQVSGMSIEQLIAFPFATTLATELIKFPLPSYVQFVGKRPFAVTYVVNTLKCDHGGPLSYINDPENMVHGLILRKQVAKWEDPISGWVPNPTPRTNYATQFQSTKKILA